MKWKIRDVSYEDTVMLSERYALDRISARILAARGVTEREDVKFFLESDISFLHNPFLFQDMEVFCDRVINALENGEKVRVFGDRDVDGITSTALMVLELRAMGFENVSWTVPEGDDPYGLTKQKIDSAAKDGVTLAITVDCGISAFEEVDYAAGLGIDFLITDHHIAGQVLPPALAIINPKVEGCGYPFSGLAGCGVAAKCIWALRLARTDLYRRGMILLHALPGNSTVIIEACRMENLMETDRISEEVVPGILPSGDSRLLRFLDCGLPIYVLDEQVERIQLARAFPGVDIHVDDMRPHFDRLLPRTRGKSLFQLASESRFSFWSQTRSELDALAGLYCALVRAQYPALYRDYARLTDLVAIGTVSDLMPMTDENRIFVKSGLRELEKGTRASLLPFLRLQNLAGRKLSLSDISWQISPQINASGRMGRPQVAVQMLLDSDGKCAEYASELLHLNKERQKLGESCWDRCLPQARKSFEDLGSKFVLVRDNSIPRGIIGILATRFQKFFRAPAFVITEKDGRAMGSIRGSGSFNCHEFLSRYSDLFDDFGGHAFAGGCSFEAHKTDELCLRIDEDLDWLDFPDSGEEEELTIDAVLTAGEMTLSLSDIVQRFEPYGEQNPQLQFMAEGARIENLGIMQNSKDVSNAHVRFTMSYGAFKWPCVFWSAGRRVGVGRDFDDGSVADIVFRFGHNSFHGQENVQLTVSDVKKRL